MAQTRMTDSLSTKVRWARWMIFSHSFVCSSGSFADHQKERDAHLWHLTSARSKIRLVENLNIGHPLECSSKGGNGYAKWLRYLEGKYNFLRFESSPQNFKFNQWKVCNLTVFKLIAPFTLQSFSIMIMHARNFCSRSCSHIASNSEIFGGCKFYRKLYSLQIVATMRP